MSVEFFEQVVAHPLACCFADQGAELFLIFDARGIVRIVGIVRQCVETCYLAKPPELIVVADGENKPAIPCRERLIGGNVGVDISRSCRVVARGQIVERLIGQHTHHAIEQSDINVLTASGLLALGKGGLYAYHAVKPCKNIGKGDTYFLRRTVRLAGEVHNLSLIHI